MVDEVRWWEVRLDWVEMSSVEVPSPVYYLNDEWND